MKISSMVMLIKLHLGNFCFLNKQLVLENWILQPWPKLANCTDRDSRCNHSKFTKIVLGQDDDLWDPFMMSNLSEREL